MAVWCIAVPGLNHNKARRNFSDDLEHLHLSAALHSHKIIESYNCSWWKRPKDHQVEPQPNQSLYSIHVKDIFTMTSAAQLQHGFVGMISILFCPSALSAKVLALIPRAVFEPHSILYSRKEVQIHLNMILDFTMLVFLSSKLKLLDIKDSKGYIA